MPSNTEAAAAVLSDLAAAALVVVVRGLVIQGARAASNRLRAAALEADRHARDHWLATPASASNCCRSAQGCEAPTSLPNDHQSWSCGVSGSALHGRLALLSRLATNTYHLQVLESRRKREPAKGGCRWRTRGRSSSRKVLQNATNRDRRRTPTPGRQAGGHWFEPSTAHSETRWKQRVSSFTVPATWCARRQGMKEDGTVLVRLVIGSSVPTRP
jgi:hypothetical protein